MGEEYRLLFVSVFVLLDPYIPGKFGGAERVCAENGSKRKVASLLTHQR